MINSISLLVPGYCRTALLLLGIAFLTIALPSATAADSGVIDSGAAWRDTDGHPIDAHGGGLLQHEGRYYWYGEIKQGETTLPACNASWGGTRVPFIGVSCYVSSDLVHWQNAGNVLPASPDVPELQPDRVVERPKVIYNRSTRQFVMWMHVDAMDYHEARTGVAVASSPTGPFRFVGGVRPNAGVFPDDMTETKRVEFQASRTAGLAAAARWDQDNRNWNNWARDFKGGQMARDLALFVDDDGTAYEFYASEENAVLHVSRLSDDYLHHAGRYRRITFDSREAPAPFKCNGSYFMVSSGCTGWDPNEARVHRASAILGEWQLVGPAFVDKSSAAEVSYLSQPAFVAPVGSDSFLFMADRWNKDDLANSRYVWLPVTIANGAPQLQWKQVWNMNSLLQ